MKTLSSFIAFISLGLLLTSCDEGGISPSEGSGTGGSRARFTIMGDQLYAAEGRSLRVFDIKNPAKPEFANSEAVTLPGFANPDPVVETIYPLDSQTLIVGALDGAYFYDLSMPTAPRKVAFSRAAKGCDPVVANQRYAFASISSKRDLCSHSRNEVRVLDIQNLQNIQQVNSRNLTNPRGLGLRQDRLFVADSGLKVYDLTAPASRLVLEDRFPDVQANDVIPLAGTLLVIADASFVQYEYTDQGLRERSRLTFNPSPYVE
jgi:hypothetical protein